MGIKKILIIEDEPKVALFIKNGLEEHSYVADIANTGVLGKQMASKNQYDLIVLDLNLPYISGIDVCKEIRLFNERIPILILTALGTIEDKVQGFENGANDYIVKPFEFRELLARIRAHLKQASPKSGVEHVLKISNLELNTETKRVKRDGFYIELTAKEFSLLELLMRNEGKVFSRAEIAEKIWDINFDSGTNVIDVYINFLRKKVDKKFSPKLIHTQVGMGYVLRNPVS